MIAHLGNCSRDLFSGQPRSGGGPYYAARALRQIDTPARIYARCAPADRELLVDPVESFGIPVVYVPGDHTTSFELSYRDGQRDMVLRAIGDVWLPKDLPVLEAAVTWVHVAALVRTDFPAATLAALAAGRRILFDGQGLVRVPEEGPLQLDDGYDPEVLQHIQALKLSDREAAIVGDPATLGVPEVLVTHGEGGSTVYADGKVERIAAQPVDADPTGAGDAFSIAYVAARAAGLDPFAAARQATSVVAEVLTS